MSDMSTKKPSDNAAIYLSFHPAREDSFLEVSAMLVELFAASFPDEHLNVFDSREQREIVYRVTPPKKGDAAVQGAFFKKLQALFVATEHLQPHFTQLHEGELS